MFATVRAKYEAATSPEDEAIGAAANAYWAAFARTGDPNGEGRPQWPAFSAAGDVVMDFGVERTDGQARPVEGAAGRHRALCRARPGGAARRRACRRRTTR